MCDREQATYAGNSSQLSRKVKKVYGEGTIISLCDCFGKEHSVWNPFYATAAMLDRKHDVEVEHSNRKLDN